tara:strand:- start:96 stop:725 length:630 start_codon:yes stop_codon:yes gene_type:complete
MSQELVKRILSSIIILPLTFYFLISGSFLLIFFIVLCLIIAFYEWNKMSKNKLYKIFGFVFLLFSFYTFYDLSTELFFLIYVILICICTDIGGYIFGKILKGPKLTTISPNKTYAGMIGGYLLSLIFLLVVTNFTNYSINTFQLILITILLSTVSQAGDIIISYFKRQVNIKNTGNLIPGHGGLLDRIDGIIFAVPTLYLIKLTGYLHI